MFRRLLFVLLGLAGAAVAAVLWSGTAYASTPRALAAPTIPGALGGARPPAGGLPLPVPPLTPRAPTPSIPPAPAVPVPPVVRHVVAALPPVVTRTVTRVVGVVPTVLPTASQPDPGRVTHRGASLLTAPVVGHASARHATTARAAFASHAAADRAVMTNATSSAHAPATRAIGSLFAGIADSTDTSGSTPRPGAPFAITARRPGVASRDSTAVTLVDAREPAVVVLRDIARPG